MQIIQRGGAIDDVITFEASQVDVGFLRLELPASAFGGKGQLRFQIDAR